MLFHVWIAEILLYFLLLLWLQFLHQLTEILLYYFLLSSALITPPARYHFVFSRGSLLSPIFTFKLLVKKMSLLCFVHESSTLHVELTSPHLSFYYLLSILFFILMRCECNRNLRIILEIQTILQKKFTNCWCGKWLLVNEKVILMVGLNENQ